MQFHLLFILPRVLVAPSSQIEKRRCDMRTRVTNRMPIADCTFHFFHWDYPNPMLAPADFNLGCSLCSRCFVPLGSRVPFLITPTPTPTSTLDPFHHSIPASSLKWKPQKFQVVTTTTLPLTRSEQPQLPPV